MRTALLSLLQLLVLLFAITAIAFMLVEPHLEGRNANATLYQVYFNDAFLAYVYFGSIPFFVALYQAFRMLGDLKRESTFSTSFARRIGVIKSCMFCMIALVVISFAFMINSDPDDRPPGVVMRVFAIVCFSFAAFVAIAVERTVSKATFHALSEL
jgi:hypothetical protein